MMDADLQIVDADPAIPSISISPTSTNSLAGESRNQRDFGLLTVMPDYSESRRSPPP
jgi:hypothetical protein